ncbi:MAG TPA: dihydrofolate reductase family protein [Baekduia sp.]
MPGRLIASSICSLDGYTVDAAGRFDWSAPDAELHAFINDRERPIGTHLYGRRMYDTLKVWQTMDDPEPVMRDFAALWRAADKVVYSTTLAEASTPRTRVERAFDPDAVRALKAGTDRDLSIGGPTLAAHAFVAGLVDEVQLFVQPIAVGGGTPALPPGQRVDLRLEDERRFAGGAVFLRYAVTTA